jgi:hypothetical protein
VYVCVGGGRPACLWPFGAAASYGSGCFARGSIYWVRWSQYPSANPACCPTSVAKRFTQIIF